jgi:hypothetical protein
VGLDGAREMQTEAPGGGAQVLLHRLMLGLLGLLYSSERQRSLRPDRRPQGHRQGVLQGGQLVVGVDVLVLTRCQVPGGDLDEPTEDAAAQAPDVFARRRLQGHEGEAARRGGDE